MSFNLDRRGLLKTGAAAAAATTIAGMVVHILTHS